MNETIKSIHAALDAGDLRRARYLLDNELAPKGSRAFDDICGSIQKIFVSAGEKCPALAVRHKAEVQRAVIGVDDFMSRFGIVIKSSNRNLVVELVCRHIIDVIRVAPAGANEDKVREHFKIPPYKRALQTLADANKIISTISVLFPDYLRSGLVGMLGFEMAARTNSPTSTM